jgi:hypothetical protein
VNGKLLGIMVIKRERLRAKRAARDTRPDSDMPRHPAAPQIRPLTAAEFLQLELPPRQKILAPWVPEKGLVMVYSPRRMGKTLFGMSSAHVIGIGGS